MLVECPNCLTHYRVSDKVITSPNPFFRCTRCKHVFSFGNASEAQAPEGASPSLPVAQHEEDEDEETRELSFSFPPPENPTTLQETHEEPAEACPAEKQSELSKEKAVFPLEYEGTESSRPGPETETAPFPSSSWEATLSTKPYLGLFSIFVLASFLATVLHAFYPQSVEGVIRNIPWIGSSVFRNHHLKRGIALESLRQGFYRIVGNREVFVLSGIAVNQNPVSVREVQIEGAIYDGAEKEVERHTILIGNPISSRIIRDLTAQEVSILQKLHPQKSFEISPEQSREFAIVFLKPKGKEIAGFTLRVSAAGETT